MAWSFHVVPKDCVHYNNCPLYTGFLSEFDHDSAGSTKKCPLLQGVRYIVCPLYTGLTVHSISMKVSVEP